MCLEATPIEVLLPLVGPERTAKIIHGDAARYELPVRVIVKQYRTNVECDHRSYGIAFESIALLKEEVLAGGEAKDIGC